MPHRYNPGQNQLQQQRGRVSVDLLSLSLVTFAPLTPVYGVFTPATSWTIAIVITWRILHPLLPPANEVAGR